MGTSQIRNIVAKCVYTGATVVYLEYLSNFPILQGQWEQLYTESLQQDPSSQSEIMIKLVSTTLQPLQKKVFFSLQVLGFLYTWGFLIVQRSNDTLQKQEPCFKHIWSGMAWQKIWYALLKFWSHPWGGYCWENHTYIPQMWYGQFRIGCYRYAGGNIEPKLFPQSISTQVAPHAGSSRCAGHSTGFEYWHATSATPSKLNLLTLVRELGFN